MAIRHTIERSSLALFCLPLLAGGCTSLQLAKQLSQYERTLDRYSQVDETTTDIEASQAADGRDAGLISAFFGLDDALPPRLSNRAVCEGADNADGMPLIFTHEVDIGTLEPGDLRVTTQSGAIGEITCLTLAPADDPGELRTALLAGHYGSAEDQPATVEVIGNVLTLDGSANFKGSTINVTPLEVGPTIVWAEIVPEAHWRIGSKGTSLPFGGGSGCPAGTQQVVLATWAGGVTKPGGDPADAVEGALYRVNVVAVDQESREVTPIALADTRDGDNNHRLCLDTMDKAVAVSFPAGHLTDPREDLNPATSYSITD